MTRREQVVRAALALLVVATVATLVVLDRQRGDDAPRLAAVAEAAGAEAADATVPAAPEAVPAQPDVPAGEDPIPTPDPSVEQIACRKAQTDVAVRVLSFNTHRSLGPAGSLERVAQEVAAVQPDIVLLQEIDRFHGRTGGVDQAARFAEILGMDHAFGANVVQGNGQYGVAILSRFDIVDSDNHLLPNAPGGEQRGLLWATLDVAGRQVRVYNTHLQNKMEALRERQAAVVAGVLGSDPMPKIIGGDFNATPGTRTLGALEAHVDDTWSAGSGPSGTGPGGSKIDFILASGDLEPRASRVLPSGVSDHDRLYADLQVPAGTDCPTAREAKRGAGR